MRQMRNVWNNSLWTHSSSVFSSLSPGFFSHRLKNILKIPWDWRENSHTKPQILSLQLSSSCNHTLVWNFLKKFKSLCLFPDILYFLHWDHFWLHNTNNDPLIPKSSKQFSSLIFLDFSSTFSPANFSFVLFSTD
jgi:hypothetical protein